MRTTTSIKGSALLDGNRDAIRFRMLAPAAPPWLGVGLRADGRGNAPGSLGLICVPIFDVRLNPVLGPCVWQADQDDAPAAAQPLRPAPTAGACVPPSEPVPHLPAIAEPVA